MSSHRPDDDLDRIAPIRARLERQHEAREATLQLCRRLIQTSARAIRYIHRRQFDQASGLLSEARDLSKVARAGLDSHPNLLYAGYVQDAEKELVEAFTVLAIVKSTPLPSPEELGVDVTSYLNGLGEGASEARRYVLDAMRRGEMDDAERMLKAMEQIYDDLATIDFPDALTGGLRRTCDALRPVIERTRSDLTLTQSQNELLRELRLHSSGERHKP
jgi:translin